MKNYVLKLVSGNQYFLYDGSTQVPYTSVDTLFASAGSAYFSFDFNGSAPEETNLFEIINETSVVIGLNTGVTVAEGKNYKGVWADSSNTFTSFDELVGKTLDESEVSFLMNKIKNAESGGSGIEEISGNVQASELKYGHIYKVVDEQYADVFADGASTATYRVYGGGNTMRFGQMIFVTQGSLAGYEYNEHLVLGTQLQNGVSVPILTTYAFGLDGTEATGVDSKVINLGEGNGFVGKLSGAITLDNALTDYGVYLVDNVTSINGTNLDHPTFENQLTGIALYSGYDSSTTDGFRTFEIYAAGRYISVTRRRTESSWTTVYDTDLLLKKDVQNNLTDSNIDPRARPLAAYQGFVLKNMLGKQILQTLPSTPVDGDEYYRGSTTSTDFPVANATYRYNGNTGSWEQTEFATRKWVENYVSNLIANSTS